MDWGSGLTTLGGVALGSIATVAGNAITNRAAQRKFVAEQKVKRRDERAHSLIDFFAAVQTLEEALESSDLSGAEDPNLAELRGPLHRVWLAQKRVDLICGEAVRDACYNLTVALQEVVWSKPMTRPWHRNIGQPRSELLQVARKEINMPDRW
jgi:hypothetical protein